MKPKAILAEIRRLPPEELGKLWRQVNRLAQELGNRSFKTRHGIPLARNDGVKMTKEEIEAALNDG